MRFEWRLCAALAVLLSLTGPGSAIGESLTLKIRVLNPSTEARTKAIESNLPPRVRPEHILDYDGLDIVYDPDSGGYKVFDEVELKPGEMRTYAVRIDDIWSVPEAYFEELQRHGSQLVSKLSGTSRKQAASAIQRAFDDQIQASRKRQLDNSLDVVAALQHMQAYEVNQQLIDSARRSLGELEDMCIAEGKDPGQILGLTRKTVARSQSRVEEPGSVELTVTVSNPASVPQTKSVRQDLPSDVKETDILDPGGLNIGRDELKDALFLYASNLELKGKETRKFVISFKDSWGVPDSYIQDLRVRADEHQSAAKSANSFPSVNKLADRIVDDLTSIQGEAQPTQLNGEYISFFRGLRKRLQSIERDLLRMEDMMNPPSKPSDDPSASGDWSVTKAPDTRTTWGIIWGISIFLLIIGLSTLGRWVAISRNETIG